MIFLNVVILTSSQCNLICFCVSASRPASLLIIMNKSMSRSILSVNDHVTSFLVKAGTCVVVLTVIISVQDDVIT